MHYTHKLRVAISDRADALEIVKDEIHGATGFAALAEFQEIENHERIVELRLSESRDIDLGRVARSVARKAPGLDVLSTWQEARTLGDPLPSPPRATLEIPGDSLPDVARRALDDALPTAAWHPTLRGAPNADRSYWLLAVPKGAPDGPCLVGMWRRAGYSHRFSARDAMAAAPAA